MNTILAILTVVAVIPCVFTSVITCSSNNDCSTSQQQSQCCNFNQPQQSQSGGQQSPTGVCGPCTTPGVCSACICDGTCDQNADGAFCTNNPGTVFKFSDGFFCDNNAGWTAFGTGKNVIHNSGCWGSNTIQFMCPGAVAAKPTCVAHICSKSACDQNQFGVFCTNQPGLVFKFTDGFFCDNNAGFAGFGANRHVIHNSQCWGTNKVTFV